MKRAGPVRHDRRRAFTLIELLVVITIITILAGLVLVALTAAQEKAKEAQTKAVITKLNAIVMAKYDSYQTRRVPTKQPIFSRDREEAAYMHLMALRELMKIEMPDRYTDITTQPQIVIRTGPAASYATMLSGNKTDQYQGAECLYLMVMANTADGSMRGYFSDRDIGDRDNDGMPEFRDGWNNPISFLRWPAGFVSQLQRVNDAMYREKNPDPFDPDRLHEKAGLGPSWAIYPLIYSPGPDGASDIEAKDNSSSVQGSGNQRYINPYDSSNGELNGTARDNDGNGEEFYDNITNHDIQTSSQQ